MPHTGSPPCRVTLRTLIRLRVDHIWVRRVRGRRGRKKAGQASRILMEEAIARAIRWREVGGKIRVPGRSASSLVGHGENAVPGGGTTLMMNKARCSHQEESSSRKRKAFRAKRAPSRGVGIVEEGYSRKMKFRRTPQISMRSPSFRRVGPGIGVPLTVGTLSPVPR